MRTIAMLLLFWTIGTSSVLAQTARWSRAVCPEGFERTEQCVVVIAVSARDTDRSWVEAHARVLDRRVRITFLFAPEARIRGEVYLVGGRLVNVVLNSECNERLCRAVWHPTERQLDDLRETPEIILEFRATDRSRDNFVIPRRGLLRGIKEILDLATR
jgi:hypothetical protein